MGKKRALFKYHFQFDPEDQSFTFLQRQVIVEQKLLAMETELLRLLNRRKRLYQIHEPNPWGQREKNKKVRILTSKIGRKASQLGSAARVARKWGF